LQIQDFEYLLAVADHANIGRAAQALGISQPALTKAVHRIEKDVGLPLFTRGAKGVVLTEAGQAFVQRSRTIWLAYADAMQEMQQMRGGQLGRLRVGFSPSVSGRLVVSAFAKLLQERPAASLELRERLASELVAMLQAGKLDLALTPALDLGRPDGLMFEPLYADRFQVMADRSHPLRRRSNLKAGDIAQEQWILPNEAVPARQWLAAAFRQRGLAGPHVRVEAEFGRISMWSLAQGSPLLTICNDSSLEEARRCGLEILSVPELEIRRDVCIVTRAGAWHSPLAERLAELLRTTLRAVT
jgi:DNA-binding transcriptional LysR family regulator